MTEHVFDFSKEGVRLSVKYEQLVIEPKESPKRTVPLKEIGVLIFSHPMISCTQAVFSGLAENGGAIVICNSKHLPTAMMLPLVGHSTQCERLIQQSDASLPMRKQLWRSIVKAKICSQAKALEERNGDDHGLAKIAKSVRSGDLDNREAHAARRYWPLLFKGHDFRRNPDLPGINAVLNYGYAVLRAITARAICGAGLHPTLGLHHHNRYNPYCLADDLMEPFRPVVDKVAAEIAD
ncbi:MAG: type II CRISPR-associated endonuclease Cas1, partial [Candidatus Sumerlaeota bacterium]